MRTVPHCRLHFDELARQGHLVLDAPVQADGGGFAEEQVAQCGHEIGMCKARVNCTPVRPFFICTAMR